MLIAGYYGFGNLGDELLLEASISLLNGAGVPNRRIAVLSADPSETERKTGVRAFNRWKMGEVANASKMSRSMLFGGGGLFQDATSVRSALYYWGVARIAKFFGAVPWAVGQSVGPFSSGLAARLAKNAFRSCAFAGVRDKRSLKLLKDWGVDGVLSHDLVLGFSLLPSKYGCRDKMLLNVRPWGGDLAERTAGAAQRAAESRSLKVVGVAFAPEDKEELERLSNERAVNLHEITLVKSAKDFENIQCGAVCAAGMRLHFLVLSALCGLPMFAAAYDAKVNALCSELDIPILAGTQTDPIFSVPKTPDFFGAMHADIEDTFSRGLKAALGE